MCTKIQLETLAGEALGFPSQSLLGMTIGIPRRLSESLGDLRADPIAPDIARPMLKFKVNEQRHETGI